VGCLGSKRAAALASDRGVESTAVAATGNESGVVSITVVACDASRAGVYPGVTAASASGGVEGDGLRRSSGVEPGPRRVSSGLALELGLGLGLRLGLGWCRSETTTCPLSGMAMVDWEPATVDDVDAAGCSTSRQCATPFAETAKDTSPPQCLDADAPDSKAQAALLWCSCDTSCPVGCTAAVAPSPLVSRPESAAP